MKPRTTAAGRSYAAPFLRRVVSLPEKFDRTRHPFDVRAFSQGIDLSFRATVTFFVGENGSGKSTLLEALAECCGFGPEGGSRDHNREALAERSPLAQALRLSWLPKVSEGFFLRAESFYNFATYIDQVSDLRAYGGKPLHQQSHGESFLALFANRFEQGIYILDEPEAALSPQRQLAFLKIIHDLAAPAAGAVPHRDALAHHPQLSGRGPPQPGRRLDRGDRVSRHRALPRHPRFPERAGAVLQAPLRRRTRWARVSRSSA